MVAKKNMSGHLYVVSMPIGNFEDITLRALRVLKRVHVVAAEDPNRTKKLFDHYGVHTPLTSYHNLNKEEKTPILLRLLEEGQAVAVVCDAGTPVISDPGSFLVSRATKAGVRVVPIPGPSATLAALAVSGMAGNSFVFQGYLPKQPRMRHRVLRAMRSDPRTQILFETLERLPFTLSELASWLGNRRMVLARDLSGADEQVVAGTAKELHEKCGSALASVEVTLVVKGAQAQSTERRARTPRSLNRRRASGSSRGRRA